MMCPYCDGDGTLEEGAFGCECKCHQDNTQICPNSPVGKLRALIARWDGIEPAAEFDEGYLSGLYAALAELEGGATP